MQLPNAPELVVAGLAAALLVGSVAGFANTEGGSSGPVVPGVVRIEGFSFGPDATTIDAGSTVTWTNFDNADHSVSQNGAALLDSPDLATGDTYEVTFEEPGAYEYFCKFHPTMQATITVEG